MNILRLFTPNKNKHIASGGYLIVAVIVLTSVLGAIWLTVAQTVSVKYSKTKHDIAASSAIYAAELGVSDTVNQLSTNTAFSGYTTKKTYYSSADKGKADYTTTVTTSGTNKVIRSTGYVYTTPSDTNPLVTRSIQVIVKPKAVTSTPVGGPATTPYAVYAGSAGLSVSSTSYVLGKQVGFGDIYDKGKLTAATSSQVGFNVSSSSPPSNIYVNNVACTNGSLYPSACPSSQQPITVSGGALIKGAVCAPNQTTATSIQDPGLVSPCSSPTITDATFDKAAFTATMTAPSKSSTVTASKCSSTIDQITWTDKTIYNGNLTTTNDCEITLQGSVYIKGNLTLGDQTIIVLPANLRSTPPTVVVDGTITFNGADLRQHLIDGGGASLNGAPIRFISFASASSTAASSCRTSNICNTPLTGTEKSTYETTTNVQCINGCTISNSLLWSYHGTVLVDGSSIAGIVNGQGVIVRGQSQAGATWNAGGPIGPAFNGGNTMPYTQYATDIVTTSAPSGWEMTDYRQIYD